MRVLQLSLAVQQGFNRSVAQRPLVAPHFPRASCTAISLSSLREGFSVIGGVTAKGIGKERSFRKAREVVCMASAAPVEVLVKAAVGQPDKLGDCPFSQRVLLTLEEKGIPYDAKFIDTSNKPAWFLDANPEGKVPVIKDNGKWVADSDVITVILEEKFPEPSLAAPEIAAGAKIFPAFVKFLVSKDRSDGTEQALLEQLTLIDNHLKENGPYLNGEKVSALDLALAPKLYHLTIALKHYQKWSIPSEYTTLSKYIETVFARESFLKTKADEEGVVNGWKAKVTGA